MSRGLVALALLLLVIVGAAVWAAWTANRQAERAARAEAAARTSSLRAKGLRLVAESQAMLSGARSGGDVRAILELVAADRLAPSPEAHGALLNVLLTARDVSKLVGTGAPTTTVAFSPDGRRIVSGSGEKTLRLWDAATGQPIGAPLEGHKEYVSSVAFSPDGRRIVSGSEDKTLPLWPAPDALADEVCAKLTRNMSRAEWREWVAEDIPYATPCPELPIPPDEPGAATPVTR